MKDKLVIWAENEKNEKVMLGIQLLAETNKIEIFIFPEPSVTETFEKAMMNDWRKGESIPFPEGHTQIERELSMSESLLPDEFKTEMVDLVNRAKTEWHFVVLSQELSLKFKKELEELKEKVEGLTEYSSNTWNELKGYWGKVQKQIHEKTLAWKHTNELKDTTNSLFDKMKVLRTQFESELQGKSIEYKEHFSSALNAIEEKLKNDGRLKPLFEELKSLQKKFWDTKFVSKHRNELKKHFDKTFKVIKEKRFGDSSSQTGNAVQRVESRMNGLNNAINRMQSSIGRDTKELEFQQHRIDTTDGQLEAQIRQAKINVVQERLTSKKHKLEDMLKTKEQLTSRLASAKIKETQQKEEAAKKAEIAKAKEAVKAKIATEIKAKDASISEEDVKKMEEAAKEIKTSKIERRVVRRVVLDAEATTEPKAIEVEPTAKTTETTPLKVTEPTTVEPKNQESAGDVLESVVDMFGEVFEDIVDSVKAVAEVLEDKVEDFIEDIKKEDGKA